MNRSLPLPVVLRMAVWLIGAEAVGLAGVTVFLLYEDVTATATSLSGALFVTACAGAAAATLGALARALYRGRGGARGLTVVLQLMLLPIGYYMIKGELPWLGAFLLALGSTVCGLLLTPASTRALGLAGAEGAAEPPPRSGRPPHPR